MSEPAQELPIHRRARWRVGAVVIALAGAAMAFDGWYQRTLISRERQRHLALMTPYASALESAVGRRISRLSGLKALVESRRTVRQVLDEFPAFAEGLRVGVPGIRALELVENGKIIVVSPLAGNETVLGYDLLADTRPTIGGDVRRAMETGRVTITGPIALVQGGEGMVVRQRVARSEPEFPDLVAMVLDVPAILDDAKGLSRNPNLDVAVVDRAGFAFSGDRAAFDHPDSVEARIADGSWFVFSAPRGGWSAAVERDLRPTRLASALIVILLAWVSFMLVDRQEQLVAAVGTRTRELRTAVADLRREVDDRMAAEAHLERNAEQLRLALAAGRMGTWDWSVEDDRLTWSESVAALFGIDSANAPRTRAEYRMLVHPDDQAMTARHLTEALAHDRDLAVEHRLSPRDGEDRWVFVKGVNVRDERGKTVRVIGIVIDTTERRRLEEQLLHSQKMEAVGTLAGGIAHDFNNLLTAILGFARLVHSQAGDAPADASAESLQQRLDELRIDIEEVLKAGERASLLTAQLLAFSRRQVVQPTQVDLSTVVHDVERMLRRLIGEHVSLETEFAAEPVMVLADPGQLAQVVVNLAVNARDALPRGGTIRVRTQLLQVDDSSPERARGIANGLWAVLTVSDNGIGMTPGVAQRVFEPFFTTKDVGAGTGLGLSTVYGIATQCGGQVLLDTAPGEGATFRVVLPATGEMLRTRRLTPIHNKMISQGEHILIVEDEPGVRRLTGEILRRNGYRVSTAEEGAAALEQIVKAVQVPDLVLTDVVMPGIGGRALASELTRRGLDVPVLFMSGYPDGDGLPDEPGRAFLGKPFTPDGLLRKVRELLDA